MDQFFANGRQGLGTGLIDLDTAVIRAALLRGYTYNSAHAFVSDVTGAGGTLVSTVNLASVTFSDGVLDANDATFTAVAAGAAVPAILLFQASAVTGGVDVAATAQRLLAILDGRFRFIVAAAAAGAAVTVTVEALQLGIANGAVATLISGTGPATITLSAAASAGARSLTVSALSSGVSADAVYEVAYTGSNLPITPNGGDIAAAWSNGANRILRI
ncbi:MAG: hypothetical protein LW835_17955 [Burkholderiaceae bacterium]|nr:hypothetical protein [Burkholderiaceae bacterium]